MSVLDWISSGKKDEAGNAINAPLSGAAKTGIVGDVVGDTVNAVGTFKGMFAEAKIGSARRMDERGVYDKSSTGNIGAGAAAGAKLGKSVGGVKGMLVGGLLGGIGGLFANKKRRRNLPTWQDQENKIKAYDRKLATNNIVSEDALAKQQPIMAEDGLKVTDQKMVEVEADELVLRKAGKIYRKVADFKGGKTHEQGGEPYMAKEGDIIIPGAMRQKANNMLKYRRYNAINGLVAALPEDTDERFMKAGCRYVKQKYKEGTKAINVYEDGTKGVKTDDKDLPYGFSAKEASAKIYRRLIDEGFEDHAAKAIIVNVMHESAQFTKLTEMEENVHGTLGYGMAQWTGERRTEFENFLEEEGKEAGDLEANIDFLVKEWKGETGHDVGVSIEKLNNMKDLTEASNYVLKKYENPAEEHQTEKALQKRMTGAEGVIEDLSPEKSLDQIQKEMMGGWSMDKYADAPYKKYGGKDAKEKRKNEIRDWWMNQDKVTTSATKKGQKIADSKAAFRRGAAAGNPMMSYTGASDEEREDMNWLEKAGDTVGSALSDMVFTGSSNVMGMLARGAAEAGLTDPNDIPLHMREDGYGFSDDRLQAALQDVILPALDGKSNFDLGDTGEVMSKYTSNLLFGEEFAGSDLYRAAEFMKGMNEKQREAFVTEMRGKLSGDDLKLVEALAYFPEDFKSDNIDAAFTYDIVSTIATLGANPAGLVKGGISTAKLGKGLITAIAKGGAKGAKAAYNALKNPAARQALKAQLGKAGTNMSEFFSNMMSDSRFKGMENPLKYSEEIKAAIQAEEGAEGVSRWQKAADFLKGYKNLPAKAAKRFEKMAYGRSYDEIQKDMDLIQETTGMSFKELSAMTDKEISNIFKGRADELQGSLKSIDTEMGKIWPEYNKKKEALEQMKKSMPDGAPDIKALEDEVIAMETRLGDLAVEAEGLAEGAGWIQNKGLMEAFGDVGGLSDIKNIEKETSALQEQIKAGQKAVQDGTAKSREYYEQLAKTQKAETELSGELGKARSKFMGLVNKRGKKVGEIESFEELAEEFPKIAAQLEKNLGNIRDAKNLWNLPEAHKGIRAAINSISREQEDPNYGEPEFTVVDPKDTEYKDMDKPDAQKPLSTEWDEEKLGNLDDLVGDIKGTNQSDLRGKDAMEMSGTGSPTKEITEDPKENSILDGVKNVGRVAGDVATAGLNAIADYAPAIHNIKRGLEDQQMVDRRTITPVMNRYQDNSQATRNMIDDAFTASLGNARNLSSGSAASFRGNAEKAWADRLARTSQVNQGESARADQIAQSNVAAINRSREFNSQVQAKADVLDMQAEAATKGFLAQGMQDVANVGVARRRDANAARSQQVGLNAIGTTNFLVDEEGNIKTRN